MVTLAAPLSSTLLPQLNNYRLTNFLTDLTISCVHDGEQESFTCHKLVVSSVSDFLAGLLKENPCSHPIIIIHTPPVVFSQLMTLVYTGTITVGDDLLPDFLSLCDQLKISRHNFSNNLSNNEDFSNNKSLLSQALEKPIKEQQVRHQSRRCSESPPTPPSRSSSPLFPHPQVTLSPEPTSSSFPIPILPLFDKPLANLLFQKPLQNPSSSSSSSSRIRATDPRPCPKCGKIYRSAHTLRTHLEDKHTSCPGYRCVLCGTVAKSRNSLHSHMSRQHRGISTKELPVVPMPSPFDPILASKLLAKVGRDGVNYCETEKTSSSTSSNNSDPESISASTSNNNNQLPQATSSTGSVILDTYLQFIAENHMFGERLASAAEAGGPGFNSKKFKLGRNATSHSVVAQQQNCIYDSD